MGGNSFGNRAQMKQQLSLAGSAGGSSRRNSFRHKPDGKLDPAGEVGWYLQYERERRGETLADAAAETKIKATYLHALEQGALDQLPGWPYALGFVRGYAKFLGLEPEPLVEHYTTFIGKPAVIDRVGSRSAWWRRSTSLRSAAAMIGIVSISVIGFWAMFQDGPLLTARSELPDRKPVVAIAEPAAVDPLGSDDPLGTAAPVANADPLAPTQGQVAENVQVLVETVREAPVETASASAVATTSDDAAPEATGSLAPVPRSKPSRSVALADRMAALDAALPTVRVKQKSMGSTAAGRGSVNGVGQSDVETALAIDGTAPDSTEVPSELTRLIASALDQGIEEEVSRQLSGTTTARISPAGANPNGEIASAPAKTAGLVRLRARDNVWMRVEDRGGEVLISQTLARGEVYEVPEREGLVLIVRDAGALEYSIGDNSFTTLGQPGQILVSHPLAASKIGKLDG